MLSIGEELHGRYKIEALLGEGGMGAVYRASDWLEDGRPCAVKEFRLGQLPSKAELDALGKDSTQLHSNPNALSREQALEQFRREAKLLKQLDHPNLPKVFDYFTLGTEAYIVMTLIEGKDLVDTLQANNNQPLDERLILSILDQILSALSYCHEHHVIHRDIKPDNIILTTDGKAYLVDFGIAKDTTQSTNTTTIAARAQSPGYAPPEQGGISRTDERSDIYSLGATLYTLCTGQIPVHASDRSSGIPLPPVAKFNPKISQLLAYLVDRCMKLDRNARFQTVIEIQASLSKPNEIHGGERRPNFLFPMASPPQNKVGTENQSETSAPTPTAKQAISPRLRLIIGLGVTVFLAILGINTLPKVINNSAEPTIQSTNQPEFNKSQTAILLYTSTSVLQSTSTTTPTIPLTPTGLTKTPASPSPTTTPEEIISPTTLPAESTEVVTDSLAINAGNITRLIDVVNLGIPNVNDIAFSPDNKILAFSTYDKIILATGPYYDQRVEYPAFSSQIGFSYDGKYLITFEGNQVKFRDIETMKVSSICNVDPAQLTKMVTFSKLDWVAVFGSYLEPYIAICTSKSSQPVIYLNGIKSFSALAVFTENNTLAAAIDNTILIWKDRRAITSHSSQALKYTSNNVVSLTFSPSGEEIITSDAYGIIEIWSITNQSRNLLKAYGYESRDMGIIPGTDILVAATYGQILFLSTDTLEEIHRIEAHDKGNPPFFTSLAFTSDAHTIAAASDEGYVYILQLEP